MKNQMLKILVCLGLLCLMAGSAAALIPLRAPIKLMYKAPNTDSEVVYEIPIEVTLLGITEDLNWYRVRIKFEFGFIKNDYSGWVNIPVGTLLHIKYAPENIP